VPCFASIGALPLPVEHVIFTVGDPHIEAALEDAIAHRIRAATLMSSLVLEDDRPPLLRERIAARLRSAGILACGANGMGFCNFRDRVRAYGFVTRDQQGCGNITMISHSGSGLCGIMDADERLRFNLAISPGQELTVTMADYLDFALDQPDTRVVGLFMETVRDPRALMTALQKAAARRIPIVALKVGRTELSARLAVSHTGAIAGSDASYDALFDRYGVQRVRDMDELATALLMFAQPHPVGRGGLVTIHDSGGERQLLIDVAADLNVPLTTLSECTSGRVAALLDPGLPAVNPLDAWSAGGDDAHEVMAECLATMLKDDNAALGAVVHDRVAYGRIYPAYPDYLRQAHAASGKPVFLVANRQGTGADPLVTSLTHEGYPVLDGLAPFLTGVRCLLDYRDFHQRIDERPPELDAECIDTWRYRLDAVPEVDVPMANALLATAGLPVNPCDCVDTEAAALQAWQRLGCAVVMKTARADIPHKSDVGGVVLDINDEQACRQSYRQLVDRFGPVVLMAPMIRMPSVEMILGMVNDPQFGPVIMIGTGGIHAELLRDVRFALAPFGVATARRLVDSLRLRALLDGVRGQPAVDIDSYCQAAARLSVLAWQMRESIAEIDINPIIVHQNGCIAVDALLVPKRRKPESSGVLQ
jgi:acetate---CoA ligase (ADP-forming)